MSSSVEGALRAMRYYDRSILRGKRMVLGWDYCDECDHQGHEGVLGFLGVYVNDVTIPEDAYQWDDEAIGHLCHVRTCRACMARVYSVPSPELDTMARGLLRAA